MHYSDFLNAHKIFDFFLSAPRQKTDYSLMGITLRMENQLNI